MFSPMCSFLYYNKGCRMQQKKEKSDTNINVFEEINHFLHFNNLKR